MAATHRHDAHATAAEGQHDFAAVFKEAGAAPGAAAAAAALAAAPAAASAALAAAPAAVPGAHPGHRLAITDLHCSRVGDVGGHVGEESCGVEGGVEPRQRAAALAGQRGHGGSWCGCRCGCRSRRQCRGVARRWGGSRRRGCCRSLRRRCWSLGLGSSWRSCRPCSCRSRCCRSSSSLRRGCSNQRRQADSRRVEAGLRRGGGSRRRDSRSGVCRWLLRRSFHCRCPHRLLRSSSRRGGSCGLTAACRCCRRDGCCGCSSSLHFAAACERRCGGGGWLPATGGAGRRWAGRWHGCCRRLVVRPSG